MTANIIKFVPRPNPKRDADMAFDAMMNFWSPFFIWPDILWGTKAKAKAGEYIHWSDCAVNNGPALPVGQCDCGGHVPAFTPSTCIAPDGGDCA